MKDFLEENEDRCRRWAGLTGGSADLRIKSEHCDYQTKSVEMEAISKGVEPNYARRCTEVALENMLGMLAQSRGLREIHKLADWKAISEEIDSSAVSLFQKYSLGLVRRTMPRMISDLLVATQVMDGPSSKVFYIDHTYGTAKAPTSAGDRLDLIANRNETYAGGRYYDQIGTGDGVTTTFDLDNAGADIEQIQVFFDGVLQTGNPVSTINAGAGAGGVDQVVFAAAPANGVVLIVSYTGYQEGDTPRDIDLQMSHKDVTAEDIALRAGFTIQALQDARSQHALDIDSELSRCLSEELLYQVDGSILDELFKFAGAGNVNFNTTGYLAGDTTTAARNAYDEGLYKAINSAANLVWTLKHKHPNFIVGGTDAVKRLENLRQYESFKVMTGDAPGRIGGGNASEVRHRVPLGTLGGSMYTVYKDARMPSDKLLLGYKGSMPFHAGYIYAPYVMLFDTGLLMDPAANFKAKRGMLHRAGRCRVDMNNYATVTLV